MDETTAPVTPETSTAPAAPAPVAPAQEVTPAPAPAPQSVPAPEQSDVAQAETQAPATSPMDELYKPDAEPVTPDVPEVYNFDGINLSADDMAVNDGQSLVSNLGHELKLSNDQARTLFEKGMPLITERITARRNELTQSWLNQVKSDPELGGDHFNETSVNYTRAFQKYGSREAYDVLNKTGLGSCPAIVRMMNAIGKDLGEESKFVNSSVTAQNNKSRRYRSLYNNSPELNFGD